MQRSSSPERPALHRARRGRGRGAPDLLVPSFPRVLSRAVISMLDLEPYVVDTLTREVPLPVFPVQLDKSPFSGSRWRELASTRDVTVVRIPVSKEGC